MAEEETTVEQETVTDTAGHTSEEKVWDQGMKGFLGGLIVGIVAMGLIWLVVDVLILH